MAFQHPLLITIDSKEWRIWLLLLLLLEDDNRPRRAQGGAHTNSLLDAGEPLVVVGRRNIRRLASSSTATKEAARRRAATAPLSSVASLVVTTLRGKSGWSWALLGNPFSSPSDYRYLILVPPQSKENKERPREQEQSTERQNLAVILRTKIFNFQRRFLEISALPIIISCFSS